MNRRTFCTLGASAVALGSAGCLSSIFDEPPGADEITESFFDALNDGEIDDARELLHSDSPVSIDEIDLSVYEAYNVRTMSTIWMDPDETIENTSAVPDAVLNDDDRTWVSVSFGIYERGYHVAGVYELRRPDEEWRVYEEVDGDADALAQEPFPELSEHPESSDRDA